MRDILTVSGEEFDEFAAQFFPRATELLIIAAESNTCGVQMRENQRSVIAFAAMVWPQSQEFSDEPGCLDLLSPRAGGLYSKI